MAGMTSKFMLLVRRCVSTQAGGYKKYDSQKQRPCFSQVVFKNSLNLRELQGKKIQKIKICDVLKMLKADDPTERRKTDVQIKMDD